MKISQFKNYEGVKPVRTLSILDWLEDDFFSNEIESIRREPNKSKRDKMKSLLPAITPSGVFSRRSESGLIQHSGFIQFDVDKIAQKDIEKYKRLIASFPYTYYCGLSVSGRGLWGLFKIKQPHLHKKHFAAMQMCFKDKGIVIDPAPSNVASLRGYSYDENAYFNYNARTFEHIYDEPVKPKKSQKNYSGSNSESVADDFNENGEIESLLIEHGWTFVDTKGTNNRYTRPGKTSGISANYCTERKLFFVWSTDPETGLKVDEARAFNHWSIYVQLECGGDQTEAARKLYEKGFGNPSPFQPLINEYKTKEPRTDLRTYFKQLLFNKNNSIEIEIAGVKLAQTEIKKLLNP